MSLIGPYRTVQSRRPMSTFGRKADMSLITIGAMTRYKGRSSSKIVERAFPHVVEIAIPLGGLGKRLNDMRDFHLERGLKSRTRSCRREGHDYVRWCFANAELAKAFVDQFGGEVSP